MRPTAFLLLCVAIGCGAQHRGDLDHLQGTWSVDDVDVKIDDSLGAAQPHLDALPWHQRVEIEKAKREAMAEAINDVKRRFEGVAVVIRGGTATITHVGIDAATDTKVKFELDPGRYPKGVDVITEVGDGKQKTNRGIYRLEGDDLTLAFAGPDAPRPVMMVPIPPGKGKNAEGGVVVIRLKRKK